MRVAKRKLFIFDDIRPDASDKSALRFAVSEALPLYKHIYMYLSIYISRSIVVRNSPGTRNFLLMSWRFLRPFRRDPPSFSFRIAPFSWHGIQLARGCNHLAGLPCVTKILGRGHAFVSRTSTRARIPRRRGSLNWPVYDFSRDFSVRMISPRTRVLEDGEWFLEWLGHKSATIVAIGISDQRRYNCDRQSDFTVPRNIGCYVLRLMSRWLLILAININAKRVDGTDARLPTSLISFIKFGNVSHYRDAENNHEPDITTPLSITIWYQDFTVIRYSMGYIFIFLSKSVDARSPPPVNAHTRYRRNAPISFVKKSIDNSEIPSPRFVVYNGGMFLLWRSRRERKIPWTTNALNSFLFSPSPPSPPPHPSSHSPPIFSISGRKCYFSATSQHARTRFRALAQKQSTRNAIHFFRVFFFA